MRGHFVRRARIDPKTGKRKVSATWSVYYDLPHADSEPRRQRIKSGFKTRREAEAWFTEKAEDVRSGIVPRDESLTLGRYLEEWLTTLDAPGSTVRGAALRVYRAHVQLHINPLLGKVRLSELSARHIEIAKLTLTSKLRSDGHGALSARTVRHIYSTLRSALARAKRQRIIAHNPCDFTSPPSVELREMQALDADGAAAVLSAVRGTAIDAAIVTAIGTGLRRGELLALRWSDVDLEAGTLTVARSADRLGGATRFKEPKTKRSRRTIHLPAFVTDRLRSHRLEQAERLLGDGLGRSTPGTLLFEQRGKAWVPNTFATVFWRALRAADVKHVRLHDLRHSFATMALAAGVDLKVVSASLGHSTISTTADVYAHVTSSMAKDAAERINAAVAGASARRKA